MQNQVFNDPAMFDAAKNDAYRTIEASGLPPAEKEALKKKTDEMFSLTVGEREIRNAEANPGSISGAAARLGVPAVGGDAVDTVVDRIIGVESGGKANAKNPNSSASGLGQFIDSTWIATVRKYRPDIASGRSNQELIALKTDPQLGREMTRSFTQENAQFLANQGIQQTPGNIYLAHFLGPRGAAQVLKSDPNASIESIVGPGVVQANGFLRGKTAAQVAEWATGKMGGAKSSVPAAPADPRFANLSLSQRLSLYDQMQAAAKRGQTAIDAQQTAAYNQQKGALQLGIQTGEIASSEQILSSGMTDSDKATLISALRSRQGDQIATAEAVAAFQAGGLTVDPYSTDGRKRVDAVGDVISKAVPAEQQQAAYEELVRQSGTLPQSVLNKIRAGADSQVASEVEAAMHAASRFAQVNPSALGRREGGEAIQRKADDFDYYVNTLNLSPSDAARRIAEQNDPNKVRDRKALEPAAKEFRKQLEGTDIGAIFDDSVLGWRSNPNVGFTEGQAAGIAADYLAIAEEQFYATGGNTELAKSRTNREMKRLYGVTEIGGSKTIMKHPPERFWPSMPGASDPYAYAKDQLVNDLAAAFPDDPTLNPKKNGSGFVGTVAGRTIDIRDESGLADYRKMVKDNVLKGFAEADTAVFGNSGAARSAGAAAVEQGPTHLKDEGLIKKLWGVRSQDPLIRSQLSDFDSTRQTVRQLAETPLEYAENAQGVATEIGGSVETRMKMWQAPLADTLQQVDTIYAKYFHNTPDPTGWQRRLAPMRSEMQRVTGGDKLTFRQARRKSESLLPLALIPIWPNVLQSSSPSMAKHRTGYSLQKPLIGMTGLPKKLFARL
ncbi:hypothetical protein [Brucella sp. 191011898]|uniref:lytic transglycosylase domain-containing protein n=1 Tax=Brucella sp. 191011898 TaxID=2730447 RepID=UPI0015DE85DB|nr:hypothetical protein [Brucella sp. 191011898]